MATPLPAFPRFGVVTFRRFAKRFVLLAGIVEEHPHLKGTMSHVLFTLMVSVFAFLFIVSPLLMLVIRYSGKRGQPGDAPSSKETPPDKGNTPPDPGNSPDGNEDGD